MTRKLLCLASTALFASLSFASATTITQTATFPTTNTDWTTSFTLNDFNTSLGTLNSVTASLADTWNTSGTVTNTATNANSFYFSSNTIISESGGPTELGALTNTFDGGTIHYSLASNASAAYGPFSNTLTSTYSSVPTDLADFEGAGTFNIGLATLSGLSINGGGNNVTQALNTSANGTVTLVYNYTPTVVTPPTTVAEPTGLALLGTGLVGMAGFIRRRV